MPTTDLHVMFLNSCELRTNSMTLFNGITVVISVGKSFHSTFWKP